MSDDDNNKDKKRENPSSQKGPSAEVTNAAGSTTNVGDKDKKILDTGDVSRASIAKGIRTPDDGGVTAADIVKGTTKPDDVISYTTGISAKNGKSLNPKTEARITKELDRDIAATTSSITEDVSKLVSSGTSSSKSGGVDKDDIYSSDDSTRHLEKVQEKEITTDKEATNTES